MWRPEGATTTGRSPGTTRSRWSPRELRALAGPDQAVFYTSGRTSNEAAFLYQLFVREFGTNNLPDCSNMCHESSGVALREAIGVGKGTVQLDDFDARRRHLRHRPEPGHQPPAHADDAAGGGAPRLPHRQHQPAARGGAGAVSRTRRIRSRCWAAARRSRALHLPVRIGGDVALLKGVDEGAARARTCAAAASVRRPTRSSPATPRASTRSPTRWRAEPWDALMRRAAASTATRCARWPSCSAGTQPDDRVLGDGPHAAQARGREHPGDRQPAAAARQRRARRARACARCAATATCRAIARWASITAPPAAFLDALGAALRLRAAAPARARHRRRDRSAMASRPRAAVRSRSAATSCRRRPTPSAPRARSSAAADRPRLDQAQPHAPGHRAAAR